MAKPGDDPSTLFRSLRPDNANFQASTSAAAREAEQRWPLFKAVSPKKSEPTPALSAQERQRWSSQEKPDVSERKPALSLPGVSAKLAQGLSKMSGRAATERPAMRAEREQSPSEAMRGAPKFSPEIATENRGSLFSRVSAVAADEEVSNFGVGLSGNRAAPPVTAEPEMPTVAGANDSLASIFNRLESKEKVADKPASRRPSFLGRLGRR